MSLTEVGCDLVFNVDYFHTSCLSDIDKKIKKFQNSKTKVSCVDEKDLQFKNIIQNIKDLNFDSEKVRIKHLIDQAKKGLFKVDGNGIFLDIESEKLMIEKNNNCKFAVFSEMVNYESKLYESLRILKVNFKNFNLTGYF